MKKIMNKKVIFGFLLGILVSTITVYAVNYTANEISFTTTKNSDVKTVQDALDDLYLNRKLTNYKVLYEKGVTADANTYSYTTTEDYPIVITLAISSNDANSVTTNITCSDSNYKTILSKKKLVAGSAQSSTSMGILFNSPAGTQFSFSGWWDSEFKVIALY